MHSGSLVIYVKPRRLLAVRWGCAANKATDFKKG